MICFLFIVGFTFDLLRTRRIALRVGYLQFNSLLMICCGTDLLVLIFHKSWPKIEFFEKSTTLLAEEEQRQFVLSVSTGSVLFLEELLSKFSSLAKIKRIIAYLLRFFHNCQHPNNKTYGAFSQELHQALLRLVRYVQLVCFEDIVDKLTSKRPIPKPFQKLSPFIGKDGLLRVGDRLSRSSLMYDKKFPAILPRKHRLTELIIKEVHKENFRLGVQSLQFLVSQNFLILSPPRAIRHVISKCSRCF